MKKIYKQPSTIVVRIAPSSALMALSDNPNITLGGKNDRVDAGSFDTKEYNGVSDVNLWGNEW